MKQILFSLFLLSLLLSCGSSSSNHCGSYYDAVKQGTLEARSNIVLLETGDSIILDYTRSGSFEKSPYCFGYYLTKSNEEFYLLANQFLKGYNYDIHHNVVSVELMGSNPKPCHEMPIHSRGVSNMMVYRRNGSQLYIDVIDVKEKKILSSYKTFARNSTSELYILFKKTKISKEHFSICIMNNDFKYKNEVEVSSEKNRKTILYKLSHET